MRACERHASKPPHPLACRSHAHRIRSVVCVVCGPPHPLGGLRPLYCISAISHISAFPYQMWKCSNAAMLYFFTQQLSNALLLFTQFDSVLLYTILLYCFSLLYCISAFPHYCTAFLHFNICLLPYTLCSSAFTVLHRNVMLDGFTQFSLLL